MSRLWIGLAMLVLGATLAETASAQAYCALRDPVRRVYELYPEATAYRTRTATVGREHRQAMARDLPFTLHFNELGRHSLYVVLQEGEPIGLIHVRSERGRWGLVEVCWALDFDLNVIGFEFQRCRDPGAKALLKSEFAQQLTGANFENLKAWLADEERLAEMPADQRILAEMVLKSGLKTMALTEDVWHQDLAEIRALRHARQAFGANATLESRSPTTPVAPDVGFELVFKGEWTIRGTDDTPQGSLILTGIELPGLHRDIWWIIEADGRLRQVIPVGGWPDERAATAFQQLENRTINDFSDCATAAELAAEAVLGEQESP
ncbi:MAG: hypothetical protein MK116_01180 [Phycisphaerales bacterium]|nr:hypothetical protein [Phycisphaerales bacterium]